MEEISIHIADDHQILIDGLQAVLGLEDDLDIVGTSRTGQEVLDWYEDNESDVLILDISMPGKDGIQVLSEISAITERKPRIIILTTYDDIKLIKEVLKLGANGFLSKDCAAEHISEAIRVVTSGEQYFSPTINDKIVKSFTGVPASEIDSGRGSKLINVLTDRELEILRYISMEFTSKEIASTLFISTNTVETHRKNLLKKLDVKSSLGLAKFALINKIVDK